MIKQAKQVLECPVVLEQMWSLKAIAPSDVICAFIFYPFAHMRNHFFIRVIMWENKKTKERCVSVISHSCSSLFEQLQRIGSNQRVMLVFWSLSSWHHIPSHLCTHSAPPFSCQEHDLTLPFQAYALNGTISQWFSYNKRISPEFCSTWSLSFWPPNVIVIRIVRSVSEIGCLWLPLVR